MNGGTKRGILVKRMIEKKPSDRLRCRVCGANRDYIEGTGDGLKCTLCGSKWKRYREELSDIVVDMETLPIDDPAHEHRVRLKKVLKDKE